MSNLDAETVQFVRETMIPPSAPPGRETGAVKWMRENLFSSWFNVIMTLLAIWFIWHFFVPMIPWFVNGVWNADSLRECREILDGRTGGCFAVLSERWKQLLFGFYPQTEYWRPILMFIWLAVAAAPIMFDNLPRKLLIATAIYPFAMVWLIWGGSIWGVLSVAAGFGLGYVAFKFADRKLEGLIPLLVGLAVAVVWWLFLRGPVAGGLQSILPFGLPSVGSRELGGFLICLIIGVSGIALSLPIGIILALGRISNLPLVKMICVGFIEFIRGVPLITLLFVASLLLNYFLPPKVTFDLVLRVIVMVTLFSSAYLAEVIRGGLAALPKGQYEAADALGLSYWQAQRLIIMPQALKISIPGIVNSFIGLFMDTSLVMFIGIFDMLGLAKAIRANTAWIGIYWELYIFIGLVFWVCCFGMSQYSQWLERKLRTDHH
ncbi:Inner membrane amino-acid ABC transporter permease protein YhdY [Aquimixticola soesokkakensis]|uniref:Inner membrane amino-acid ABC transporter permease protein YhdY n=1 Tax=Aquimixticola soesokkakensis TaxID=1519096 RepID=A0A1Y5SYL1_9RHOB|nr:amino acid ABC transporter permease [Aquimixticola soesokkakensis]SLN51685.1 Inner membrane amino-acid ABC transporter permease protein YhdY [Aquimixticola soesokkakensis]